MHAVLISLIAEFLVAQVLLKTKSTNLRIWWRFVGQIEISTRGQMMSCYCK